MRRRFSPPARWDFAIRRLPRAYGLLQNQKKSARLPEGTLISSTPPRPSALRCFPTGAWGAGGQAWEPARLSDEGVTIAGIDGGLLRGTGWEMKSDREKPFTLDLRSGRLVSSRGA